MYTMPVQTNPAKHSEVFEQAATIIDGDAEQIIPLKSGFHLSLQWPNLDNVTNINSLIYHVKFKMEHFRIVRMWIKKHFCL